MRYHRRMEVVLSSPRGFCAGVVRAIDIVEIAIERFGAPVYVRHEIVHNTHVVNSLREQGAVFIDEVDEAPDGATIIFSAHGVAPEVWAAAQERGLRVIDATCPLVTKVHIESRKYAKEGYSVVVVGHEGHPEVVGTMGQSPEASVLVNDAGEAESVMVADPSKVVALTQTTLSVDDTAQVIGALKERFPQIVARNDICYATTNRQDAVKELVKRVDLVLVVGAENSSNCNRLREVAEQAGLPAYLIADASGIDLAWLEGKERVGVTSGASTPESLVEGVIDFLKPERVSTAQASEENVSFVLPRELRDHIHDRARDTRRS